MPVELPEGGGYVHFGFAGSYCRCEWFEVRDIRPIYYGLLPSLPDDQSLSSNECPICSSAHNQGWEGGPINTRTGNYHYDSQDISIPALGHSLRFERSYNSLVSDLYTDTLGYGWTHNYDINIAFPDDPGGEPNTLIVRGPHGSRFRFWDNGGSTYTPLHGVWATLTSTVGTTPTLYTLTGVNRSTYIFTGTGQLIEIHSPQGQVLTLSYTSGRLARVEDDTGQRYLTFSYDGEGRLEEVRDPISRTVQFGYDVAGDLTVVTDTMNLAWTYTYTGTHLLYDVLDPDGNLLERTDYDEYDGTWRAARQWQGDLTANPLEIEYGATGVVTITDPMGYVKTHGYDARGTLVQKSSCCGGGGSSSCTYDTNFNWTSTTDANDNPTYYDFNSFGRPEVITDAIGGVTQMTYDDRDHLTTYTDALTHTTVYTYDEYNNLVATSDAMGNTTVYTYNASGQLMAQEDPVGNVTQYGYDTFGQRTVVTDAMDYVTTYGYDAVGRLITVTQYANTSYPFVTVNTYDNGDHPIRVTRNYTTTTTEQNYLGTYNLVTEYGYDVVGRRVLVTDTLGYVIYSEYNDTGRLVRTTRNYSYTIFPDHGPGNDWNLTTEYGYDDLGRQVLVTDTLGTVTYTEYDALGRVKRTWRNYLPGYPQNYQNQYNLITEYGYDDVGNQTLVTNTLGYVTRSWYDKLNRVVSTTVNYSPTIFPNHGPGNDWNLTTWYGYDAVGRQVWVTDTMLNATYTEYDKVGRPVTVTVTYVDGVYDPAYPDEDLISVTVYDEAGQVTARIDPAERETRYEYDDLGRQVAVIQNYEDGEYEPEEPDRDIRSETVYDDLGQVTARVVVADERITTTYEYDIQGRLITTTNALSGTTVTHYDVLGRRWETIDAEGLVTRYGYDAAGRLISSTVNYSATVGPNHDNQWNITTQNTYDALGRRVAVTDALTHTTVYTYNAVGQLVAQEAPLDNITLYEYDALGRRTVITDADGVVVYSFYDAAGRLIETRDALGNSTHYGYDALGRRVTMTNAEGIVTKYEYDKTGRLVAVIENYALGQPADHETNVRTEYDYDASGNLVSVTDGLTHTTVYTYDLAGRRVAEEDPLGNVTHYVYDGHGRRVSEVYPDAAGPITVTTDYNALGWPTQVEYPAVGDAPGFTVTVSYDALGHREVVTDAVGVMTYDYDPLYRPLGIDAPTGDAEYVYNALGQRINLIYPTGEVVTYTHDAAGRLRTVTDWEGGVTVYTYTTAGRLSEMRLPNGVETHYDYDDAGRLVEIEHSKDGEELGHYEYKLDDLGNRVIVTETLVTPNSGGMAAYGSGMSRMAATSPAHPQVADPTFLLMVPLMAAVALARKKKWKRLAWPVAGVLLIAGVMGAGVALAAGTDDYAYVRQISITNRADEALTDYPVEITTQAGTGFNHAALVSAGKSQADGDDLRVFSSTGVELDRWIVGANTANCKIWVNLTISVSETASLYLYYGNGNVGAPSVDDDYEPAFNLSTSTNMSWDYDDFGEDDGLRTGAWTREVILGTPEFYGGNHGSSDDPWSEIGIYCNGGTQQAQIYLHNPCGIQSANFTGGEKWVWGDADPPPHWWDGRIRSSTNGSSWTSEYTIPMPSSYSSWESWSRNEMLDSGASYVGILLMLSSGELGRLEVTDCTLALDSSNTPAVVLGSETTNTLEVSRSSIASGVVYDQGGRGSVTSFVGADYTDGTNRGGSVTPFTYGPHDSYTTITRTLQYIYDPLGRLTDADYSTGESYEYAYDEVGNRTEYTVTLESTTVTTYTYDAANRLTAVGDVAYTWDERGNLTNNGVFTYTYNAAGRLVQAESVTSTLVYTYTAGGLRVAQSIDGDEATYAWDWASGLPEMLSEGGNLYLVGHETLGQWNGDEWAYYLSDGLGSVRQVTDETGAVIDAREWTPYGVEVDGAQAGLGYTGEWQDATLGLTYLRARWYDSYLNQFVSPDPIVPDYRNPQSINGYTYVLGNPVNFMDPSGKCRCGPDVTKWYQDDLVIWRNYLLGRRVDLWEDFWAQKEKDSPIPLWLVGPCVAGAWGWEEHINSLVDFSWFGRAANYKFIDFNYADQPNREGECPSPRCKRKDGQSLTPSQYLEETKNNELEPYEMCCGGSVTLCNSCIHREELGNFWLGYAAYQYAILYLEVEGAAWALTSPGRESWDKEAIKLGYKFAAESELRIDELCPFLAREGIERMTSTCFLGKDPCPNPLHTDFGHFVPSSYVPDATGNQSIIWDKETWGYNGPGNEVGGPTTAECTSEPTWCNTP